MLVVRKFTPLSSHVAILGGSLLYWKSNIHSESVFLFYPPLSPVSRKKLEFWTTQKPFGRHTNPLSSKEMLQKKGFLRQTRVPQIVTNEGYKATDEAKGYKSGVQRDEQGLGGIWDIRGEKEVSLGVCSGKVEVDGVWGNREGHE